MAYYPLLYRALTALALSILILPSPSALALDAPGRPSAMAACGAWREHISDLIDQHRIGHELDDDTLMAMIMQFSAARDACTSGDAATGLKIYEAIPLGRVQKTLLK